MAKLPIPFGNPATYPGHSGVDFPKPQGTVFRASGRGVVTGLGYNDRGGYYIWVKYDVGCEVGYHHMPSHHGCPSKGTWVDEGTMLGYVGTTGRSTGPHLHSEVYNYATTDGYWQWFTADRVVGGGSASGTGFSQTVKDQQAWLISRNYDLGPTGADGIAGPLYTDAVKKYQTFLRAYGYAGDIDGDWGPGTQAAHAVYYNAVTNGDPTLKAQQEFLIGRGYNLGSTGADGIWGPATEAAIKLYQEHLRAFGYTGDIDGQWGPGTQAAHEKFVATLVAEVKAPAFPLPAGKYFGPEGGGEDSISGYYSYNAELQVFQQRLKDRGYPVTVDGYYGPKGATTPQGNTAENVIAFQNAFGLEPDGKVGPITWEKAWTAPINSLPPTPAPPNPTVPVEPTPVPNDEAAATPNLITPSASDFPAWIQFDVVLDPEAQAPLLNKEAAEYYGKPYNPVESHLHWWGAPGQAGTHAGNVSHLRNTKDLSVNFVVSEKRITLMVPINKIALTTGARNPFAWKSENDPTLTDWQYKTMGYLHYIIEKLNPVLLNQPLRHHKEFYATSCSEINKAKVREYAEAFRTGKLDPATGLAPVVVTPPVDPTPEPDPTPTPDTVAVPKELYALVGGLPSELRKLADDIDEYMV